MPIVLSGCVIAIPRWDNVMPEAALDPRKLCPALARMRRCTPKPALFAWRAIVSYGV